MMQKRIGVLALMFALGGTKAVAESDADGDRQLDQARQCTEVVSRAQRLACFDEVFDTQVVGMEPTNKPSERVDPSPYWQALMEQATEKGDTTGEFQVRSLDYEQDEPQTVVVTTTAGGSSARGTVMALSCRDNITRLEFALARPISSDRVAVTLSAGDNSEPVQWRVRDNGWMVHAGRGLPAIETLRAWLDVSAVQFGSRDRVLDGMRFDLSELDEALKPLRRACGW